LLLVIKQDLIVELCWWS